MSSEMCHSTFLMCERPPHCQQCINCTVRSPAAHGQIDSNYYDLIMIITACHWLTIIVSARACVSVLIPSYNSPIKMSVQGAERSL